MTEPSIDFPTENLEKPNHAKRKHGPPTEGRWGGGMPEDWSPQRRVGVREAKQYSRAIERGIPLHDESVFIPGEVLVTADDTFTRDELALFMPTKVVLALREPHWRVIVRAASVYADIGGRGFVLKHRHAAHILGVEERSSERVMPALVATGALLVVAPMHVKHGAGAKAPKSRTDGYAYVLAPYVLGAIAWARATSAANAVASPEGSGFELERSRSSQRSPTTLEGGGGERPRSPEMAPQLTGRTARLREAIAEDLPPPPEAPEGERRGEPRSTLASLLRELVAEGAADPDMVAELVPSLERSEALRQSGLESPERYRFRQNLKADGDS